MALDLIGFGKSDKPDIEYTFADHQDYLQKFIDQLGLKQVILVMHDWGSGLGFDYATNRPSNLRGLVFFESMLEPIPSLEATPPGTSELFAAWRSGVEGDTTPGSGWDINVRQNFFLEVILPNFVVRGI